MSTSVPINAARRTKTYAAGALVVANGIKTSIASSTSAALYVVADFNGTSHTAGVLDLPRSLTVGRSNAAAQYSVLPIVITGYRGGELVTESLTPANANGSDTLVGTKLWDRLVSVAIPANAGTGGAYTIGVQDIGSPFGRTFTGIKLHANGNLNVQYGEAGLTDSIPCLADKIEPLAAGRVLTNAGLAAPTSVGLTVYMG